MRTCSSCGIIKEENKDNFRLCKYKNGKTYYHSICRDCERASALEYAKNHREERKQYQREYTAANPEYGKNWKIENRDEINRQERNRHATDINFRLKKNVSRSINRMIRKNGDSTFNNLPYTAQELREHLEKQFDDKMTWDNYGSYWHIDHIIPHSIFRYTSMKDPAFMECWSLKNLRPLEARQNRSDGATKVRHKR
jgi:hypothetical protein